MLGNIWLNEYEIETTSSNPYLSKTLSNLGLSRFPELLKSAITDGNNETLFESILNPSYWLPTESYQKEGVRKERKVSIKQAAERLATGEFSTFYVRGLCKKLIDEGVEKCEIYRAAIPKWEVGSCTNHEGLIVDVLTIYNNHRKRYWPEPGNDELLSIPFGPGCHHLVRRVA